jgi:hypothetical protein
MRNKGRMCPGGPQGIKFQRRPPLDFESVGYIYYVQGVLQGRILLIQISVWFCRLVVRSYQNTKHHPEFAMQTRIISEHSSTRTYTKAEIQTHSALTPCKARVSFKIGSRDVKRLAVGAKARLTTSEGEPGSRVET